MGLKERKRKKKKKESTGKAMLVLQVSRSRRRSWSSSWPTSRWGCCGGAGEPRRTRLCVTPSLTRCWPPCPTSWSRPPDRADPRSVSDKPDSSGMSSPPCPRSHTGPSAGRRAAAGSLKREWRCFTNTLHKHLELFATCVGQNLPSCHKLWRWKGDFTFPLVLWSFLGFRFMFKSTSAGWMLASKLFWFFPLKLMASRWITAPALAYIWIVLSQFTVSFTLSTFLKGKFLHFLCECPITVDGKYSQLKQ